MRRILVEGQVGLQVLSNRIRVHPLRSLAVKRHSGELIYWIIKEEKRLTFKEMDPIAKEVWQQIDDETSKKVEASVDGGDVRQYVLATAEFPDIEDYVYGFAWHFKGLLNEIDNMAASLGEATANAAWAILLVDPLANVTAEEIKNQWISGSAAIGRADQFKWLNSGIKLNDFAFIAAYLQDLRDMGRDIFLDEEPQAEPDVTATAILRRAERLDKQTSDLLVSLETSLQKPLVEAVEAALRLDPITVDEFGPVQIAVTTGSSAIQQDMRAMRGLQKISLIKELDPMLTVDGVAALEELGRGDGFNYKRVVSRITPQDLADAEAEAAGATGEEPEGTVAATPGGPQPKLNGEAETVRREGQRIPPVAA